MPTTPEIIGGMVSVEVMFSSPTWTAVTGDVRSITTKRGTNRGNTPILRSETGVGSVTLNNSTRKYDPTNASSPYNPNVLPMKPIRMRATHNAITYGVIRGFVDSWDLDWNGPNWSVASVPFQDGFKVLNGYKRIALTAPVGEGEDAGARITRVLNSVSWPIGDRSIAVGQSQMQGTLLEGSALDECQLVADSELGEFYCDGNGLMVFRDRHAIVKETRSTTVQATFGDGGGSELPYEKDGLKMSYDHQTLANLVQIGRVGGTPQTASDATSINTYLTQTFNRQDLIIRTDPEAQNYATWIMSLSKNPELRFESIRINPLTDPTNLFPQVLGREIGDRIRILLRPPGGGSAIQRDVFIRGIEHSITPSTWHTTWTLQSASTFGSYFTLDHASLGLLGNNIQMVY